jgi:ribonuclease HII
MTSELVIGVDEAGLGPLLGPFCLAAFCTTRQWGTPVKDSKKLHKKDNLAPLVSACSIYLPGFDMKAFKEQAIDHAGALLEPWYEAGEKQGICSPGLVQRNAQGDRMICLSVGVSAFNESLRETGNKSETTSSYLSAVLAWVLEESKGYDRFTIWVDRQGGRKHYAPLVEAWGISLNTHDETPELSRYRGHLKGCPCEINFAIKADTKHHVVAAASCFAKLRREMAMEQFNRWWKNKVPGLKSTAGYWEDGLRFLSDVEFCRESLKINLDSLRRNK